MPTNIESDHLFRTPPPRGGSTGFDGAKSGASDDEAATPRTPSLDYVRLSPEWADVVAVCGGTRTMREMGTAYLPMEPGEDDEAYARRLGRATLTPYYKFLTLVFASQILRKPITVSNTGGLSEADFRQIAGFTPPEGSNEAPILGHLDDLDGEGSSLQQFAFEALSEAIRLGYAGIEVTYPNTQGIGTRAQEIEAGVRPRWSIYSPPQILGDRKDVVNSRSTLTQLRLLQYVIEPDGEWGERCVEQVLVYRNDETGVFSQVYREGEDDEWQAYGKLTPIDLKGTPEIPFAFLHCDRKGRKTSPPMLDVAYLNIRHYQVSADMDNSLHVAAIPRLVFFGCEANELGDVGGVGEAICIPNPEARGEWLAPSNVAFEPNQQRLEHLASEMLKLGLSSMSAQKNVGESAEAKRLDRSQGDSTLAVLAQNLQQTLNNCLKLHCAFMGIDPSQSPTVAVSRDFDLTQLTPQMVSALANIANIGKLSTQTLLELLQKGELGFSDDWTPAIESERLQAEFSQQTQRLPMSNGLPPLETLLGSPQSVV